MVAAMTTRPAKDTDALAMWTSIPRQLQGATRGLRGAQLDRRSGPEEMSVRETVHHLVEANLIASNIIIAALANSGSTYDWTWVNPGGSWIQRLGYSKVPVEAAIATLSALSRHLAAILTVGPGRLGRTIQLFDAPGAPVYTKTVRQILLDEVSHATHHLAALPLRTTGRKRGKANQIKSVDGGRGRPRA